jgi:hypothetical protein
VGFIERCWEAVFIFFSFFCSLPPLIEWPSLGRRLSFFKYPVGPGYCYDPRQDGSGVGGRNVPGHLSGLSGCELFFFLLSLFARPALLSPAPAQPPKYFFVAQLADHWSLQEGKARRRRPHATRLSHLLVLTFVIDYWVSSTALPPVIRSIHLGGQTIIYHHGIW